MDLNLEAAGCTDTGALRMNNEDAFLCCREQGVFVVCDGMGGAAGGEVASRMAAECVSNALCAKTETGSPSDDVLESALIEAIADANRRIYERAQREAEVMGMGTTIVTAHVSPRIAHVAHVGDSRCYLWREGRMELLTQDHSLVGEQVRMGRLSLEEAENSPYRNVITRALGTQSTVMTEYQRIQVQSGDVLLLCSDGLTRELNDGEIAGVLARAAGGEKLDAVCQVLVERANAAGGRDNITCVLVRV
jgi:protein phosphatase